MSRKGRASVDELDVVEVELVELSSCTVEPDEAVPVDELVDASGVVSTAEPMLPEKPVTLAFPPHALAASKTTMASGARKRPSA